MACQALAVDRTRSRSIGTVDRRAQKCTGWAGRPHGRPPESSCSLEKAPVDRAVDRGLNGQKSDRWPVDRAVDRQVILAATASFF